MVGTPGGEGAETACPGAASRSGEAYTPRLGQSWPWGLGASSHQALIRALGAVRVPLLDILAQPFSALRPSQPCKAVSWANHKWGLHLPWGLGLSEEEALLRRLFPVRLAFKECGGSASLPPSQNGRWGVEVEGTLKLPPTPHLLFLDRKCVMEWEEPHDSTLYCLQTDGNHLLATGSSYYGVVRLWDRRQRACLHVSIPPTSHLQEARTHFYRLHLRVGVSGDGGREPIALGLESWFWAPPPPTWATPTILVPSLAGLPADVDTPEQSCVLPALHHQASLCCTGLQPPHPGLSKPVTVRATPARGPRKPATQGPILLGGCSDNAFPPPCLCSQTHHHSARALKLKAADSRGAGVTQRHGPSQEPVERRALLLWESDVEPTGPCSPVGQSKDLAWRAPPYPG